MCTAHFKKRHNLTTAIIFEALCLVPIDKIIFWQKALPSINLRQTAKIIKKYAQKSTFNLNISNPYTLLMVGDGGYNMSLFWEDVNKALIRGLDVDLTRSLRQTNSSVLKSISFDDKGVSERITHSAWRCKPHPYGGARLSSRITASRINFINNIRGLMAVIASVRHKRWCAPYVRFSSLTGAAIAAAPALRKGR